MPNFDLEDSSTYVQCPHCRKPCTTMHNLKQHIFYKHPDKFAEETAPLKPASCPSFLEGNDCERVKTAACGISYILCKYCHHEPFASYKLLVIHMEAVHPQADEIQSVGDADDVVKIDIPVEEEGNNVGANGTRNNGEYSREDNRRSYSNEFKARVIHEVDCGASRRSLSVSYNIPLRTLEKWLTKRRHAILNSRNDENVAHLKRLRSNM